MADTEGDITAAELALGVLEGEDRAAAMRRVLSDPEFAHAVERWRDHFGQLSAQWPEVSPPARVGARIDRAIAPAQSQRRFWPALALTSSALAAVLAGILLLQPAQITPPTVLPSAPALVASLVPAQAGGAPVPAIYDPAQQEILVAASALELAPAGRSAELWLIPADGKPRSLGLLMGTKRVSVKLNADLRALIGVKAALAVSDEPPGGSRTGQPTGAILASGSLIPV
jgi:anti-sigma-K factor RskA